MRRIHPPKDHTGFILACCIFFIVGLASLTAHSSIKYIKLSEKFRLIDGKQIDLPEEINTLTSTPQPLQGYIKDDVIHIEFPDK